MSDEIGWSDTKDNPNEPDAYYEVAYFVDGERTSGVFSSMFAKSKYRRRSEEEIARIKRVSAEKSARENMEFSLLPLYRADGARCVKCGHDAMRVRCMGPNNCMGRKYGEYTYMQYTCKRCRHQWDAKPLDWENPR